MGPRWVHDHLERRYRYAYVDRHPQDRHVPVSWRIGSAVARGAGGRLPPSDGRPGRGDGLAALPDALVALRRAWEELDLDLGGDAYRRAGQQVARTLEERDVLGRRPVLGVELPLRDELASGHRLIGMLDLALRLGPTTVQIVDHKVTGWRSRPEQLAADLQLNLYGALARIAWPDTTAVVATHHYPTGPEAVSVRLQPSGMEAARRRVVDVARAAIADETFAPTPGDHCDHCPWRPRCPAG